MIFVCKVVETGEGVTTATALECWQAGRPGSSVLIGQSWRSRFLPGLRSGGVQWAGLGASPGGSAAEGLAGPPTDPADAKDTTAERHSVDPPHLHHNRLAGAGDG